MFERIINILVIESDPSSLEQLCGILKNPNYNIFKASNNFEALKLINQKDFVIVILNLDNPKGDALEIMHLLHSKKETRNISIIVSSTSSEKAYNAIEIQAKGVVDYLIKPYKANLVLAKVEVFKKFHFRHLRINKLLESILPTATLSEFGEFGKSSPKKKTDCAVMFTDFVNFTEKTKNTDPQELVKTLDYYFSKFDEITLKYNLEKIKTIGDAYMVVGGVTEQTVHPSIRMALAAVEIRNFVINDDQTKRALGKDFWQIRIGIHVGDLVAGVVGKHKFSFDVWGDTVNIAARCEQHSTANQINISNDFKEIIAPYFNFEARGEVEVKHGGLINMFYIKGIKLEHSQNGEGRIPNIALRKKIGLPETDFDGLRTFILNKLKSELNENLTYHSVEHTEHVEKAVIKYAQLEKLNDHDLFLLNTAALFHDAGYLYRYDNNETLGVDTLRYYAPMFGYQEQDMAAIEAIILSTAYNSKPKNILEAIMCDADLDYLGRMDYHITAKNLFDEMALHGHVKDERTRLIEQIDYLENHHQYYTTSAINLRQPGKEKRLTELKSMLKKT